MYTFSWNSHSTKWPSITKTIYIKTLFTNCTCFKRVHGCIKQFKYIFKAWNSTFIENYLIYNNNNEPITIITELMSQIFERHVNRHLMSYLNKYCLIHDTQSGFRQKQAFLLTLTLYLDPGDFISAIYNNASPSFILCFRSVLSNEIETLKFKLLIRNRMS